MSDLAADAAIPATCYGALLVWLGGAGLGLEIHAPLGAAIGCSMVGSALLAWVGAMAHARR